MEKPWDIWMAAFAGGLMGLLASVVHILADRSVTAAVGPVPIVQVFTYIVGAALLFAVAAMLRNLLVRRRPPPAGTLR